MTLTKHVVGNVYLVPVEAVANILVESTPECGENNQRVCLFEDTFEAGQKSRFEVYLCVVFVRVQNSVYVKE